MTHKKLVSGICANILGRVEDLRELTRAFRITGNDRVATTLEDIADSLENNVECIEDAVERAAEPKERKAK